MGHREIIVIWNICTNIHLKNTNRALSCTTPICLFVRQPHFEERLRKVFFPISLISNIFQIESARGKGGRAFLYTSLQFLIRKNISISIYENWALQVFVVYIFYFSDKKQSSRQLIASLQSSESKQQTHWIKFHNST